MLLKLWERVTESDEVLAVLITALLTAIGWIWLRYWQGSARLLWGRTNQSHMNVQQEQGILQVQVHSFWFQNMGRKTATDLEISMNWKPLHYEVYPHVPFEVLVRPDLRYILRFNHLRPRESLLLTLLNTGPAMPEITSVRLANGTVQLVNYAPHRLFPRWVQWLSALLALFGLVCLALILVRAAYRYF
jgi:hypothetical protein